MSYLVLPSGCHLERALDQGGNGYVFEHALLRKSGEHWELAATSSYVCAIVQLELVKDDQTPPVEGLVSAKALAAITNTGAFRATEDRIEAFRPSDPSSGAWFTRPSHRKPFPALDRLWTDAEPVAEIALDARLLKDLSDGLGETSLHLKIFGACEAVQVAPLVGNVVDGRHRGLIMPIEHEASA